MSDVFHRQRLSVATLWSAEREVVWLMRREVKRSDTASVTFSIFFPSCCFRFSYITILFQLESWKSSFSTVWKELIEFLWLHCGTLNPPSTPDYTKKKKKKKINKWQGHFQTNKVNFRSGEVIIFCGLICINSVRWTCYFKWDVDEHSLQFVLHIAAIFNFS